MFTPRWFPLLGLVAATRLSADTPDAVVTFNEIHFNPPTSQEAEWIELHNQMAVNVDLSGWSLADGIDYVFPSSTVIPGGGYLLIAKTPGHASLTGIPGVRGPFTGNLSNSGETVDLLSPTGRLMDRVSYGDTAPWPVAADGPGATLAKRLPGSSALDPANWRFATATPATLNFRSPDQPLVHVFTNADTTWRYRDNTAAPSSSWENTSYNDSLWSQGQAPFATTGTPPVLSVTANLVERYRAGAVTGVANGATFSPWTDTATGDGVSQNAVPGSNPAFQANATPSGEPAIDFDGNDEFRTSLSPGIAPTSGFVYFIVCRANAAPNSGSVTGGEGAYLFDRVTTVGEPLVSLKAVNGRYGFQKRYDDGGGIGGPVSTTSISTTQFQIVAVRRNPAESRFELWVDGVMEGSVPDDGSDLTPQPIVMGCHGSSTTQGFNGDIAELLVYRNALGESDFQATGAYLEAKYGLATAFPDGAARTSLATNASTSYFRKSFTFTGDPARTTLELGHTLADGAVFYLNGQEISRSGMPGGAVAHSTSASADLAAPAVTAYHTVPSSALVSGTNVLAVSVHTGASDNTAYFTANLRGIETPVDPDLPAALELNEIAASGAVSFFIEVRNPSSQAISTNGFTLEVAGSEDAVDALPTTTVPAGGLLHFNQTQLGFRPGTGDKIILRAPGGAPVDAQIAEAVVRGRSAAWPNRWLYPSSATAGAANAFALQQNIVINEICYHPPELTPASADKEWIELRNRGASTVNLGGWRVGGGIEFTFPANTMLATGGHLIVAKNPGSFPVPGGVTVLGPWSGSLANSGETVTLFDSAGNPADEVKYFDGGRWPGSPDGDGSTLELRDPRSDNSLPEAWSASDESTRRTWQNYSYRITAAASRVGPDGQWREFIFGLLDSGDVLIDDIAVIENPDSSAVPMIDNGNFSAGTNGWRFLGNHRHAQVIDDPDQPGNPVLRLSSKGPTEHMHNHVETTLASGRSVVNGRVYEIRYRARWLGGSNRLNTRLYFNRCAKTTELTRTEHPGTPGTANSAAVTNAGPGFTRFIHSPAVPDAGGSVTVTARAADPDGLGTLTVHYAVNGGSFTAIPMTPSGDGTTFTGAIPGQATSSVVRFYVSATDAGVLPQTSYFPAEGASSHALYQVNDGLAATNGLHNLRIVMDPADEALLYQENNLMSNERLGCTVIYDEREIYYDAGVRLKSSQRGRPSNNRVGFNLGFNQDQLFRGAHRTVAIDRSDGQETGCREILFDHTMAAGGGIPAEYNDLCKVIAPNPAHTSHAILQMARFGDVFLDSQFENGSDGTGWEYELIYYPTTTDGNGYKLPQPDGVVGTDLTDLGDDKEAYRWNFLLENNEDKDDYSRIIAAAKQFAKNGSAFETGLTDVIDPAQWLQASAHACTTGAGDSFFDNSNHNGIFYARPDGRVLYFPHDMDFSFSATRGIFDNSELQKLVANPARRRLYLGHLHHLCTTVFNQSYLGPWATHYGSLLPGQDFAGHLSYINTRSNYILGAIQSDTPSVPFAITTNGGANFSTPFSPASLAGSGWVNVRNIRLAGSSVPLAITWTSSTEWQVAVPIGAGPNAITLEAVDFTGAVIGSDSIVVTNTGGIALPAPSTLVVSEIYYNPPGDVELTEYVELTNVSNATLDLSSVSFEAGVEFTFPGSTLLAPGARILVVKDTAAFNAAFGTGRPVVGTFPNSLDNAGEQLRLVAANGDELHDFIYSDQLPWPLEADGDGYSLVLINPASAPDHDDPRSWRASAVAGGGTPGLADTQSYAAWKTANGNHGDNDDLDGDGFTTREEYFLGGNPQASEPTLAPTFEVEEGGSFLMTITRRATAEGASVLPEISTDLEDWDVDASAEFIGSQRESTSPAVDRLHYRITPPPGGTSFFARFAFGP
ncbi:lamin tail domain-containing protein [Luteolibacter arcticus]|uniref:Lamin tail domain-containing protein n=1 Tax=Luteolibacter arcticus TaxID=1581411 RepID=A0ABT3GFM6_9BACT|nr:lamin tail domain-containing protein [Luteolibacter arcticus]MCW1922427.1 lamin tail domain-containing protein [Luteolibacter arcticus]